jgi:hypothetical protein
MAKGACYYCERPFSKTTHDSYTDGEFVARTKDHIIPSSKGGNNTPKNIVIACQRCNKLKGNMMPEEFLCFLENGVEKHSYHGFRKANFFLIIHNTKRLIESIKDMKHEMAHGIPKDNTVNQIMNQVLTVVKSVPSSKQQERSLQEFVGKFARKYPYAYELMISANPDLPRWVYDNLIKEHYEKETA